MESNLTNGLIVTVLGMGMVFTFLVTMICVMKALKVIVDLTEKWFPSAETQAALVPAAAGNEKVAVAIAAAKSFIK